MSNKRKLRPTVRDLGPVSAGHVNAQAGWTVTVTGGGDGRAELRLAAGVFPEVVADYQYQRTGGTWSVRIARGGAARSTDLEVSHCPGLPQAFKAAATAARAAHPGTLVLHTIGGDPDTFTATMRADGGELDGDFDCAVGPGGTGYLWPAR